MTTVNGWIIMPRDLFDRISHYLKDFVETKREYGKCVDLQIKDLPQEIYAQIIKGDGVVSQCK